MADLPGLREGPHGTFKLHAVGSLLLRRLAKPIQEVQVLDQCPIACRYISADGVVASMKELV